MYRKSALACILVLVVAKMMLVDVVKVPTAVSLGTIALLVGGSIALSLLCPPRDGEEAGRDDGTPGSRKAPPVAPVPSTPA